MLLGSAKMRSFILSQVVLWLATFVIQAARWFAIFMFGAHSARWLLDHTWGAPVVLSLLVWGAFWIAVSIYSGRLASAVLAHFEQRRG